MTLTNNSAGVIFPKLCYHGTISTHVNSLIEQIKFDVNYGRRDFGRGFYLTFIRDQAETWAYKKAKSENRYLKRSGSDLVYPAVLVFEMDSKILINLMGKTFERPDVNWAEFVYNNRRELPEVPHGYDFVYGPLADGELDSVLDDYQNGLITREILAKRIKPIRNQHQLSLHTINTLQYLKIKNILLGGATQ